MLSMMLAMIYLFGFIFALLPILLFIAVMLAYSYKLLSDPGTTADDMPDSSWRLSSIYDNRADPALFVQKRIGLGYTRNFGNPMSWLIVAMVLALIPAGILLLR